MAMPKMTRRSLLAGAVLFAAAGLSAYWYRGAIIEWFSPNNQSQTILLSGNIEAHQSVLGFKTVQSRIVELPFNEGQWVKAGTLLSRLDDSDYRQQVAISRSTLEVQKRQLATAEQNCAAAQKLLEADAADLELAKLEFTRADDLMKKGAGTIEARDQTRAALKKANAGDRARPGAGAVRRTPGRTRAGQHPECRRGAQARRDRARLHDLDGAIRRRDHRSPGRAR